MHLTKPARQTDSLGFPFPASTRVAVRVQSGTAIAPSSPLQSHGVIRIPSNAPSPPDLPESTMNAGFGLSEVVSTFFCIRLRVQSGSPSRGPQELCQALDSL